LTVTAKGADYEIDFTAAGHQALMNENSLIPFDMTVVAGTVKEFFDDLSAQCNRYHQKEILKLRTVYVNSMLFEFDPAIRDSKIVYDKSVPLSQSDPNSTDIKLNRNSFTIPAETQILEVIQKVLAQSQYMVQQLGLDFQNKPVDQVQASVTKILNTFKTAAQVEYIGRDSSGEAVPDAFDDITNSRPLQITYKVYQYPTFTNTNPDAGTLADSRPYVVKDYKYLYTGQNVDIIDFKLDFKTTYFTKLLGYTNQIAAEQASGSTGVNDVLDQLPSPVMSPQLIAVSLIPGLAATPNFAPSRYKTVKTDREVIEGLNVDTDPAKQKVASLLKSIYSGPSGDMVRVDLKIVGDPTLIKQDDWLYIPSPAVGSDYTNIGAVSQAQYVAKY
jgi:hypothetical protein